MSHFEKEVPRGRGGRGALHGDRNDKGPSPLGTAIFIALRVLDPVLQYGILLPGTASLAAPILGLFGGTPLPLEAAPLVLGLSPWRLTLLGMSILGSLKGIFYLIYVSETKMPIATALLVGVFKAFSTTVNSLMFCAAATSATTSYVPDKSTGWHPLLSAACAIFTLGITVETVSELQRRSFKKDPSGRGQGKVYTGGLFRIARHINYGGYTVWKAAAGLAASGWGWGGLTLLWLLAEFRRRGIPALDAYCEKRYGQDWDLFKRRTRWKMIPFVY
ncbi:hypothetical protein PENARI_c001G05510 [Penicillium arizonense]|uniref:Delta(14)-sterol reductase n=1 Tax=Penicillium arizonense TaxID=1835702 RepID=A0A1F5LYW0_PENAI|nr:hypothetical protein PENARI_c001G05510 [Penicillium arizonense]OGE58256.1 hypothetical protein PENARI_c001G05510 [Penicillium arizonense]